MKKFKSAVKNKVAGNEKKRNGTTTQPVSSFTLNNLELGDDLSVSVGNFSFEPEGCLFIPFGAGQSVFGYMQIGASYQFK
jgi:hypothetical protein